MAKTKKMAVGGVGAMPTAPAGMPAQSNFGGAMRGLDRAAAMSGRDFSGIGRPAMAGRPVAAPVGMKKGGSASKRADGIAIRGKTRA